MGGLVIVVLYLLLFYRAVVIVRKSPFAFATLLAIGCAFSLVFQAMINMAVAVNLFPVTGQPLPMLSMGGTSIWFTSIAVGIILSVSRNIEQEELKTGEACSSLTLKLSSVEEVQEDIFFLHLPLPMQLKVQDLWLKYFCWC